MIVFLVLAKKAKICKKSKFRTVFSLLNFFWKGDQRRKMRLSLSIMQKKAEQLGGEVLSRKYSGVRTRMRFKCKDGHSWWTYPYNINDGFWCPKCGYERTAKKLKKDFIEIKDYAKSKEGKCLSTAAEYKNSHTKLKWQCARGHQFKATFHNIRRREDWCKKCRFY